MPFQAHLFVGERVFDDSDCQRIAQTIGGSCPTPREFSGQITVPYRGAKHQLEVMFIDAQDGSSWPAGRRDNYTGHLVGAALTQRYIPVLLDKHCGKGGRDEPFELDLEALSAIRADVRKTWPEAEILMMDFNH